MSAPAVARPQRQPLVPPGAIDHHAADMAVTVAADVALGEVQAALAKAGQWLAIDGPPAEPLGKLMSMDSTGPLRLGYGGWRDLLTGVQLRDGRGDLVTAGGVTVKNVAGYDLVKFAAGAHGCFGEPVTLTLRTYRRPDAALAASLCTDRLTSGGGRYVTDLLAGDAPPQWMLLTPQGLRAGWLGSARQMESVRGTVSELAQGQVEWRDLAGDEAERTGALEIDGERVRLAVAPAEAPRLLQALRPARFAADVCFGIVWMPVPERLPDLWSEVRARGGHVIWLGRDGVRIFGVDPATRACLVRLKAQLDPDGRLPPLPLED